MDDEELVKVIGELRELERHFTKLPATDESMLSSADRAKYKRLVLEAKGIIGACIGAGNEFAMPLIAIASPPNFGMLNRPSPEDLHEAVALAVGGLNQLRRKGVRSNPQLVGSPKPPYVSPHRILQLRNTKPGLWDLKRLVRMLEELNMSNEREAHITTAMLVRAIADHVPPIFGHKTFTEFANNYAGGRSFSDHMKHLDNSMRKVADGLLHQQIRKSESLPAAQQVNFCAALDDLLGEVIRVLP